MSDDQNEQSNLPVEFDPMRPMPGMSPALQIMLNDKLFERAKAMAHYMSQAEGFLPKHLIGKQAACFAVLIRAITWKLDPYAVGQSTFQIPGSDRVGYEGKLIAAILENSGKLVGGVKHTHFGPWENVAGKFEIIRGGKGFDYPKPTWTRADAKDCGITIKAQVRGEADPRTFDFDLEQCYPLNSTLWATDPKTQIFYTAVRRFANTVASGLLMGVPWEGDMLPGDDAFDLNPRPARVPQRSDFRPNGDMEKPTGTETQNDSKPAFAIVLNDGTEIDVGSDPAEYSRLLLQEALRQVNDKSLLDGLWESNSPTFGKLPAGVADALRAAWPAWEKKAAPGVKPAATKDGEPGKLV